MESAVKAGCYVEVAQLAEMAQALGQIPCGEAGNHLVSAQTSDQLQRIDTVSTAKRVQRGTKKRLNARSAEFPKFEREGGRLVKIGWSKKNKAAYEHKASREVALCVCMTLGEVPYGEPFRVEELLPMALGDGTEIPSYQAYLVLAWLRWLHVVEKSGKDSYTFGIDEFNEASFQKAWESTALRGHQVREKHK
jgi:hypothetical protein